MLKRFFMVLDTILIVCIIAIVFTMHFGFPQLDWYIRALTGLAFFIPYGLFRWIIVGQFAPFNFEGKKNFDDE